MKRVVSGIQPSGDIHIGNYLGAMKRWAAEQDKHENFYFIANLHALTTKANIKDLRQNTLKTAAWLLACGLDPQKSVLFVQSQVPEHSELAWILNNFVNMGELSRMTQYKDKSVRLGSTGQNVGLFDYPVLQAADVLLYDAAEVPVGKDQKQHVELMRDVAERFNKLHGNVFTIPKPAIQEAGAAIMNLQDPTKKMSKSDADQSGVLLLSEDLDTIRKKITKAVTDSGKDITFADDKPAISNLLQIYSLISNTKISEVETNYKGKSYSEFKTNLANLVAETVKPMQERYKDLFVHQKELLEILVTGEKKAMDIARKKITEVKQSIGLL